MIREFLSRSSHLEWPLAAFILFLGVFVGVIVYIVRGIVKRQSFDREASLPLEDDDVRIEKGGSHR
jgi:cbb3-type cytochrome oxidase subunit 3